MKLHYGAQTDVGLTRDHNEDNYGVADDPRISQLGHLFVVCDGIGGAFAGQVASKLAVETIIKSYYESAGAERPQALIQAFHVANQVVHEQGRGTMGTTAVAALFYHGTVYIANVGDSRAYLIRGERIQQLSDDHSFVAEQVRAGLMTDEQARGSSVRNVITRAVGHQPDVKIDLFQEPLQVGDLLLLSSDGLHGLVEDPELASVALSRPPQEAVDQLVALANSRGGTDNITVIIIQVESLEASSHQTQDSLLVSLLESPGTDQQQRTEAATGQQQRTEAVTSRLDAATNHPEAATDRLDISHSEPEQRAAVAAPPPAVEESQARDTVRLPQRSERRLSKAGLLSSLLLLLALVGAAFFFAGPQLFPSNAPGPAVEQSSPVATPVPTSDEPVPTISPPAPTVSTPMPTLEGSKPANQATQPADTSSRTDSQRNRTSPPTATP